LLFAQIAVPALLHLAPDLLPTYNVPAIDLRVVVATTLVAALTLVLFGLAPAWRAGRADPALALRSARAARRKPRSGTRTWCAGRGGDRAGDDSARRRGLLIDSLHQLSKVDSGLRDPEHVLAAKFSLPVPAMRRARIFLRGMRVKSRSSRGSMPYWRACTLCRA
jgi:hypothetical protein